MTEDFTAEAHAAYRATLIDGGRFIFDVPEHVPAVWGSGRNVLWAEGESLMVCGGPGVGKTTVMGQLVRALVFGGDVLAHPVTAHGRTLYLAMDRPQQIARSMARQFHGLDRQTVADRLVVRRGPPPADLAKNPYVLREMCRAAGAKTVFLDSLKDAAIGLSEDAVGAGYNQARQLAIEDGIQVCEGHHQVKRGANGGDPTALADVYGSAWLTNGAGSVILLAGKPGDPVVEFRHLKQPAEDCGPFQVLHDHDRGESTVFGGTDPLLLVRATRTAGITSADLARALFGKDGPNEVAKAYRKLRNLVAKGLATEHDRPTAVGGTPVKVYVAATHGERATTHETTHAPQF